MDLSADSFIFVVFLGLLWLFLFARDQKTRREMVTIGIIAALFAPIFIFLGRGETGSAVSVLDIVFAFLFAGIAAVIFEAILGKHYRVGLVGKLPVKKSAERWFLRLFLIALAWTWIAIAFLFVLQTSSMQSLIAGGLIVGSYILATRKALFWDAVLSAAMMMAVFFFIYAITVVRSLPDISIFLLNLPAEALIWSATLGFVLGPIYEYARDLRLR